MVRFVEILSDFAARVSVFRKPPPIDTSSAFGEFLANRAAFIAQKKLYEYVKQRMGLTYPEHFKNDTFIASLNIAKWHVYAACLSDLAVWMASQVHTRTGDAAEAGAIARYWHERAVVDRFEPAELNGDVNQFIRQFADRVALTDWKAAADRENSFRLSPSELIRWAPISDELKKYDRQIVINSLRFAWLAVRNDFRNNFRHEEFLADWKREASSE